MILKAFDFEYLTGILHGMYLYYTLTIVCYFVTSSIFKGLVTYHGSMERAIKLKFNSNSNSQQSVHKTAKQRQLSSQSV